MNVFFTGVGTRTRERVTAGFERSGRASLHTRLHRIHTDVLNLVQSMLNLNLESCTDYRRRVAGYCLLQAESCLLHRRRFTDVRLEAVFWRDRESAASDCEPQYCV